MRNWVIIINRGITYSFYGIFFITPLALHPKSFELFEFNKLWIVFYISIFILFLWVTKMIILKKFIFKRTALDIPLALFLASQILSTIFSMEPHVSFWGYYARFNGGLLSLTTYIFLYYAFVSNLLYRGVTRSGGLPLNARNEVRTSDMDAERQNPDSISYKILLVSLLSGLVVALWGLPSHFGYDPTCFAFRGTFDVSCWTDAFQPTVRMFSTLGQPNWLAAYMSILIPIAVALALVFKYSEGNNLRVKNYVISKNAVFSLLIILASLFYLCLLWSKSQSGLAGFGVGFLLFIAGIFYIVRRTGGYKNELFKNVILIAVGAGLISFIVGVQIKGLNNFNLGGVIQQLTAKSARQEIAIKTPPAIELGGSDSGKIRLTVWKGAIEIARRHPLFGTGVETFAYAYYQVKPKEHNRLSEWDYLYNKAHNEYLNYLATTGILGLVTYLAVIVVFLTYAARKILKTKDVEKRILLLALVGSYTSILVSNFFGFSVVIINLYFFLIPAIFIGILDSQETPETHKLTITPKQTAAIIGLALICLYFESYLVKFWFADQKYSYGYNLDRAQQYATALPALTDAVQLLPTEDLYKDELSSNNATIALLLSEQGNSTQAAQFGARAKELSDGIIAGHPNNVVYYKTRVRVLYALSALDNKYLFDAIKAIKKAQKLAPTDAKIAYNIGLIYNEAGQTDNAIDALRQAISLKPDYRDPRYALAVYYSKLAKQNPAQAQQYNNLAIEQLNYILKNIAPDDTQTQALLKTIQ